MSSGRFSGGFGGSFGGGFLREFLGIPEGIPRKGFHYLPPLHWPSLAFLSLFANIRWHGSCSCRSLRCMSIGLLETKNIMPNLQTERTETNETYQRKKIMKPTNGTNMPNLHAERSQTHETHQQKNITKPTNGTNVPNMHVKM